MCLQAQGIDNDNGGVGRVRRSHRLSDDNRGVGRGQGIRDASEESETAVEAEGDKKRTKRNLQQHQRRRGRKISTKNTTTTTIVSAEDRQCVQGIEDDNRGSSASTTGPVYWKRKRSVGFPFFQVANSNIISTLSSRCLYSTFFSSYSFFLFAA